MFVVTSKLDTQTPASGVLLDDVLGSCQKAAVCPWLALEFLSCLCRVLHGARLPGCSPTGEGFPCFDELSECLWGQGGQVCRVSQGLLSRVPLGCCVVLQLRLFFRRPWLVPRRPLAILSRLLIGVEGTEPLVVQGICRDTPRRSRLLQRHIREVGPGQP